MINRTLANWIIGVFTAAWAVNLLLGWFQAAGFQSTLNTLLPGLIAGAFTIRRKADQ